MRELLKLQISISRQLLLFVLALSFIRTIRLQDTGVFFLLWNLFLAWLPWFFIRQIDLFPSRKWKYGIFGLSLLFLPNSIYIFTDLIHLKKNLQAPLWFDLILILSFALMGFIYYAKCMREMLLFLSDRFQAGRMKLLELAIVFLSSFGVYLGRYLRLNSWDLFTNPFSIVQQLQLEIREGRALEMMQITLFFGVFVYILNKAAQKRWEE